MKQSDIEIGAKYTNSNASLGTIYLGVGRYNSRIKKQMIVIESPVGISGQFVRLPEKGMPGFFWDGFTKI